MPFIGINHGEINIDKQVNVDMKPAEKPAAAPETKEADTAREGMLTIQQVVMLFETVLDVPLDASFTNLSELAVLLSRVSGYKSESIRVKIANGIDYEKPQARKDAELLAALLENIRPDLALKLRNGARD